MNKVELVAATVPRIEEVTTEEFAAYVARIGKVKDNPERLINYLINHKHWSPFEHTYFTFKLRTSRAIGREILRHRSCTFQELSQRYEQVTEFEPIEIRKQATDNRQSSTEVFDPIITDGRHTASERIADYLRDGRKLYEELIAAGVARECARMVLPECTSTTMLVTGNLRSWIHFLDLRDEKRAQKEIQVIAKEIKAILAKEVPMMFK